MDIDNKLLKKYGDTSKIKKIGLKDLQACLGTIYDYTERRKDDWDATMAELSNNAEDNSEILASFARVMKIQNDLEQILKEKNDYSMQRYKKIVEEAKKPVQNARKEADLKEELTEEEKVVEQELSAYENATANRPKVNNKPQVNNEPKVEIPQKHLNTWANKKNIYKPRSQRQNIMYKSQYEEEKRNKEIRAEIKRLNVREKHQNLGISNLKYEEILGKEARLLLLEGHFYEMVDVICSEVEKELDETILKAIQSKESRIAGAELSYRKKLEALKDDPEYKNAPKDKADEILARKREPILLQMNSDNKVIEARKKAENNCVEQINTAVKKANVKAESLLAETLVRAIDGRDERNRKNAVEFFKDQPKPIGKLKSSSESRRARRARFVVDNKIVINTNPPSDVKNAKFIEKKDVKLDVKIGEENDIKLDVKKNIKISEENDINLKEKKDVKTDKEILSGISYEIGPDYYGTKKLTFNDEKISTNKELLAKIKKMNNDYKKIYRDGVSANGGFVGDRGTTYIQNDIFDYNMICQRELAACESTFFQDKKDFRIAKDDHLLKLEAIYNLLRKNKKTGFTSNSEEYKNVLKELKEFGQAYHEKGWDKLVTPEKQDISTLSAEELAAREQMLRKLHLVYEAGAGYMVAKGPKAKSWSHGETRYELMYLMCNEIYSFGGHAAECESRIKVIDSDIRKDRVDPSTYTKQINNQADATEKLNRKYQKYISDEIKKINSNKVIPNDLDNVANNQNNKEQINNINRNLIM